MSNVAKALYRSGLASGQSPMQQVVQNYFLKKQRDEEMANYIKAMDEAKNKISSMYNPQYETQYTPGNQMNLDQRLQGPLYGGKTPGMNLNIGNVPNVPPVTPNMQTKLTDVALPQSQQVEKPIDYYTNQYKGVEDILDFVNQSSQYKQIPRERIMQDASLMQNLIRQKPKSDIELKDVNPENDLYKIDKATGQMQLYKQGTGKDKERTVNYVGEDGFEYTEVYDKNGNLKQTLKGKNKVREPKGTNVTVNTKENKWENFGKLYTNAKNTKKQDKWGDDVDKTEAEKFQDYEILKNSAISNLTPSALTWYKQNIEDAGLDNISNDQFIKQAYNDWEAGNLTDEAYNSVLEYAAYRPYILDVGKNFQPKEVNSYKDTFVK